MLLNTPASKVLPAALGLSVVALGAYFLGVSQRRQALYCLEQPGMVWSLLPVPPGINQECPQSASYRQEVRDGQSRVEQYRLQGWQPLTLLKDLKRAGYVLTEDETSGPNHYSVFLGRSVPAEVFYTAVQQDGQTLVTLSGP